MAAIPQPQPGLSGNQALQSNTLRWSKTKSLQPCSVRGCSWAVLTHSDMLKMAVCRYNVCHADHFSSVFKHLLIIMKQEVKFQPRAKSNRKYRTKSNFQDQ